MKNFLTGLLLLGACFALKAQDSTGTTKVYRNLAFALKTPEQVEILDLSKQKLDAFPLEIFKLTNLRELYLGKNKIETIPSEIGTLSKLEILDVSRNRITEIPNSLNNCENLKRLIANQNSINKMPESMRKLQQLEYLDLWSNDLGSFPEDIRFCQKLKEVDLRVIELTKSEQENIQKLMPKVEIHFSPYCSCSR